jgi:hypothetical protein
MRLTFLGGAETVTGSRFLVDTEDPRARGLRSVSRSQAASGEELGALRDASRLH